MLFLSGAPINEPYPICQTSVLLTVILIASNKSIEEGKKLTKVTKIRGNFHFSEM